MGMHEKTLSALEELLELIRAGELGDAGYLPSRCKLASLLGIGRGAVPSLLAELARRGITDCASGRHIRVLYRRDEPVRRRILVLHKKVPWESGSWTFMNKTHEMLKVYTGIEAAAKEFEIELLGEFQDMPATPEGLAVRCRREEIDGVIQMESCPPELGSELLRAGIPLVVANQEEPGPWNSAGMDFRAIGRMAAQTLLARGHHRIAFLANKANPWIYREMLAGFKGVLAEDDIPLRPDFVLNLNFGTGDVNITLVRDLLLARGRPTAVFAGRDRLAAYIYAAANRTGLRIPEDLSVLGYDNITWPDGRYFGLASIEQPAVQIGRAAVEMMVRNWISPGRMPEAIRLAPGPLLSRESLTEVPGRIASGLR